MRTAALVFVAALVPAVACEVAFPFDRSRIEPDGGSSADDSGSSADDTGVPTEDAASAPDALADVQDAGSTNDATLDGVADAPDAVGFDASADAVTEATSSFEAGSDAGDGSD